MEDTTSVLFVTANVGSIFEDPDIMIKLWIQEFLQTVIHYNAKFVALHCQEVGGKNYETCMQHVNNFVELLVSSDEFLLFDRMEIFLDEDFSCAENFTALGNFYFIHKSVSDVLIWNFEDLKFEQINSRNIHDGNIEKVPLKEKSKFPQNFFPECKWSRKGYLRTRWSLNGSVFDLVNIHLFHDASNFIAMESFPSVYTVTRQKALQYCLNRFYNYESGSAPFFLFGDFNFRTDTQGVIKKLTSGLNEYKEIDSYNEDAKLEYKDNSSEVIITIGKKEFIHNDHQNVFINDSGEWLKEYDREMEVFKNQLFEFPITFLPSYPFEENTLCGKSYMKTRCPAWCDRVLLSITAKRLIQEVDLESSTEYGIIGKESCMGDHKPVFLFFNMINNAGITTFSKLPCRRICSACKLSSCVFSDASELPLFVKVHRASNYINNNNNGNLRNDVTNVVNSTVNNNYKKHLRNVSRCYEANIMPMTTVSELSDTISDGSDTYYLANSISSFTSSNGIIDMHNKDSRSVNLEDDSELSNYNSVCSSVDHITKPMFTDVSISEKSVQQLPYDIVEDSVNLTRECCSKLIEYANRSYDENATMPSKSTFSVTESSWSDKICTCLADVGWRIRSVSSASRHSSWNSDNRVRLKSDPNLKTSLRRIQSHHSSSDEEWFEEIEDSRTATVNESNADTIVQRKSGCSNSIEEIDDYIEFEALPYSNVITIVKEPVCKQLNTADKSDLVTDKRELFYSNKNNYFLFCIPRKRKSKGRTKKLTNCKFSKWKYFRFLSFRSRFKLCCES